MDGKMERNQRKPPVTSVDRALSVMQLLSTCGSGLPLDELSRRSRMPKGSLHRILGALRYRGFVVQNPESGHYLLGPELLRVAFDFHSSLDIRSHARPLLIRLRDEYAETAHLGVLDGAEIVYLDKAESPRAIRMSSVIGSRRPVHCTAMGKVLVSYTFPNDDAARLWINAHAPFTPVTSRTITGETRLLREFSEIRERGFAVDLEECEPGVRCVAVPVFMGTRTPIAAVSISAPKERLSPARIEEIGPQIKHLVDNLFQPPSDAAADIVTGEVASPADSSSTTDEGERAL